MWHLSSGPNHRSTRLPTVSALVVVVAVIIGCSSSTNAAKKKIEGVFNELPQPAQTILVERVTDIGSGSDPKCWTAYSVALFGTNLDFGNVLSFYTAALPELGWRKTRFPRLFERSDNVSFEILTDSDAWASLAIPLDKRQESQQRYPTIYFVSLAYGNTESSEYCQQ